MSRAEFKHMLNHTVYDKVRKKYHADTAFPEVYDKVVPETWLLNMEAMQDKDGYTYQEQ
jgi:hypothetical protein